MSDLTMDRLLQICGGLGRIGAVLPDEVTVAPDLRNVVHEAMSTKLGDGWTTMRRRVEVHVDVRIPLGTWHEGPPFEAPPAIEAEDPGRFMEESKRFRETRKYLLTLTCPACAIVFGAEWGGRTARADVEPIARHAYAAHICAKKGAVEG